MTYQIFLEEPTNFMPKFDVVSCYLQHEGKFLLLLRNDDKMEGNTWGMPGGKVESGESHGEAVAREIAEETGVVLPASDFVFFRTVYVRYPELDFAFHMYSADFTDRPLLTVNMNEHKAAIWVTPQEALQMVLVKGNNDLVRLFYNL